MKILYFSRIFESTAFVGSQVRQVAETQECYFACFSVDRPQALEIPNIKVIQFSAGQDTVMKRIKRKLELSDLYFNLRDHQIARQIENTVKAIDPDIIHCQYGYDALILLDNFYREDRRYVITFRGFDASLLLILAKYREKLSYYLAKPNVHPVFVCHALMHNLQEKAISLNPLRAVIYSNTDTKFYTRQTRKPKDGKVVFTQISNFREKKGHRYTFEAFERFAEMYPDVDFEVNFAGGIDAHAEKFQAAIKESPIRNRIKFPGKVAPQQIRELLEESHVFVHNSITSHHNDQEGIPNAIMEAMSMELPVAATYHSGVPELVQKSEDVFLSREKNIDDYVMALRKASLAGYSAVNRQRIVTAFSKETFEKNILTFYNKVLGKVFQTYQQCTRCILDTKDDPSIFFDVAGVCNHCHAYRITASKYVKKGREGEVYLDSLLNNIKTQGKGKPYDCILGVSGDVESTYVAYVAKEKGLRPLAIHVDNGWNSEIDLGNIERLVKKLDIPLHTFAIDREEFKDLQLSVLRASVVDLEMVTDHAIITKLYDLALKHDIRYVLSDKSILAEANLPQHWFHRKTDDVNIRNIHQRFGRVRLKTYPLFDAYRKLRVARAGIENVAILDSLAYEKKAVEKLVREKLNWRDDGGVFCESVFTRFCRGYILPKKFGIDKRRAYLSNLICSNQITRQEALTELTKLAYPDELFVKDYDCVLKQLNLSEKEFENIMNLPVRQHREYGVERNLYDRFPVIKFVRPMWLMLKRWRGVK